MKLLLLLLTLAVAAPPKPKLKPTVYQTLQVPGRAQFCTIDTVAKRAILPSGRVVTPAGNVLRITSDPFGLALSPDGSRAVTLHDGVLTVLNLTKQPITATRIPDYAGTIPSPIKTGTFLGVAIGPDNRTAYLSNGDKGRVIIFDTETLKKTGDIALDGDGYEDSFTSDLLLNGTELLVLDRANFRLVRIDLATQKITASIPTGRQPFGLALSPDKNGRDRSREPAAPPSPRLAFVANVGLYVYPLVPGVTKTNKDTMALKFPPYGAHTKESREGVEHEGRRIPGLGNPLTDEAMSVWTVDLATNTVVAKHKTGVQIGSMIEDAEVVGGSSPNSVAVGSRFAYVSNATNDNVSILDYKNGHKIVGTIDLNVDKRIDAKRGLMPFGLTLSKDEKTLYIALLAFNAVAVVDVPTRSVRGLIPTGWGPTRVTLSPDEKTMYVTSARGYGAGPNGGRNYVKPPQGTYIGDVQLGTFQAIPIPTTAQLAAYTKQVLANTYETVSVANSKNPLPAVPRRGQSPIKHIVYITKENRTYDEVFGQLRQANGDSSLARYGVGVTISAGNTPPPAPPLKQREGGENVADSLTDVAVMPNHQRVAQQWAFSDNFYCDSDASIHGHHWMMGTIPNEWVEAQSASDGRFDAFSKAPGRRFPKTTGAVDPEDYNEIGGLWEAMKRNRISFYNFGEANEPVGAFEEYTTVEFGAAQSVVFPMPAAVYANTSRNYAGYNTSIPDQYRMEQFEQEFTEKWLSPSTKGNSNVLPQLITMQVPNDHGASPRPDFGFPYPHSFMADNDLAVGRILHFLSRTKYWKDMLVIITEDDPQGGVDHVDAHRSVLMMAGPYVKRGHVSHTHANFGSLLKVIYNILGVPYVNQYDQTASLLQDFFTDKPDFTPYDVVLPDKRIFDPEAAMKPYNTPPFNKKFDWRKIQGGPKMDDRAEQRAEHYRQQGAAK